jgi:hypothetical protein
VARCGEVRSGFQCNQDEGPRGSDVVKGSRMAVIDPSDPDAGTKKGRESEGPRVIHCWREDLVFYDLADRRRHHVAEVDRRIFCSPREH